MNLVHFKANTYGRNCLYYADIMNNKQLTDLLLRHEIHLILIKTSH